MAKKLGNDYRVWLETVTPGTYAIIKGNQDLSINREGGTIDISTKDDFPYAAQAAGARSVSITASFIPDLPDATGYTRLMTLANALVATPFNIQVRKGGTAGVTGDVVFECSVYCTTNNTAAAQNSAVGVSVTFVAATAPTTDALA